MKIMLKYGLNINIAAGSGVTLLHNAISHRNIDIVKLLMKNGIDLSMRAYINPDLANSGLFTAEEYAKQHVPSIFPAFIKAKKEYCGE